MSVDQQCKAVLKSAELVFELAIIDPMRFGPIIHANVPDYAEILMKIFIENGGGKTENKNFHELIQYIENNPRSIDKGRFSQISSDFKNIREQFRNPLHHTDKVQGYIIAKPIALECLLAFDELLRVLFPTINPMGFNNLNYPCYVRFINMEYDQGLGKVSPRYYQAVISALLRLEKDNAYNCPTDFDTSRLISIRHLFHFDSDTFTRYVFNYRPQIRGLIIDELHQATQPLSSNQLLPRLKLFSNNQDLTVDEIERCLALMDGVRIESYGVVMSARKRSPSGNQIIRYSFVL